ncbi:hypothetical protein M9H77_09951 [Catharanthus roseus]|uniref:Uncharacterized protein n=1 Tax=Catharanthus roseus TaxID=4058 RepID=A0ACC0C2J0_CATRO|nr:hypothetical protein M9H77_09951 [Catharanthus roseus]
MSETNSEDLKLEEYDPKPETKEDPPCPELEEERIKKKYGGLLRKKHPLISKDHDHAFFDSADWVLGKQGVPLEELPPKLQPTPHLQIRSRRSAYAPSSEGNGDRGSGSTEDSQEKANDGNSDREGQPEDVPKTEDKPEDDQNTQSREAKETFH